MTQLYVSVSGIVVVFHLALVYINVRAVFYVKAFRLAGVTLDRFTIKGKGKKVIDLYVFPLLFGISLFHIIRK